MLEPRILDLRGVEIEIILWRGTDNLLEAILKDPDDPEAPLNLSQRRVTMTIVTHNGGAEKYSQTNEPGGGHTDEANGVTRFFVPKAPTFDGLTSPRAYTWKYEVVTEYIPSGAENVYFYGDVRVMARPLAAAV